MLSARSGIQAECHDIERPLRSASAVNDRWIWPKGCYSSCERLEKEYLGKLAYPYLLAAQGIDKEQNFEAHHFSDGKMPR
jgi:hypothetical protein